MNVLSACVAHLAREMSRCRHRPEQPCRARASLPATLVAEVRRGVVSDRTLLDLQLAAEQVCGCTWRRRCGCRVAGMLGAFLLIASGAMKRPPGCAGGPCRGLRALGAPRA